MGKPHKTALPVLVMLALAMVLTSLLSLQSISLGGHQIKHGQTYTFTAVIDQPSTIDSLYPASGTSKDIVGTLKSLVAAYVETTVSWNIYVGEVIKRTDVPLTVKCTITPYFTKGEYYGGEAGQPCPDMSMCFYPRVSFTIESTPTTITHTLTVTVVPSNCGTVDRPIATTYPQGYSVTATAKPSSGYVFDSWTLNGVIHHENPITFTMDTDITLQATFTTETITSPPQKPDVWSILSNIWSQIWDWLKGILGLQTISSKIQLSTVPMPSIKRLDIVSGGEAYPNDVFQYTFNLQNKKATTIPDSDYTDGTASFAYAVWMVTDSSGNIVYKGDVKEVSLSSGQSVSISATWNVPNKVGKYVVSAILIEIPKHWDRTSKTWVEDTTTIIDKQGVQINVQSLTAPSPPSNVWDRIQQAWQGFLDWLRSIFRW